MEEIFKAANETNTALEINAFGQRLDLNDTNARRAKALNAMIAISTDTHNVFQLENMRYGVSVARRAWLEKPDVQNYTDLRFLHNIIVPCGMGCVK